MGTHPINLALRFLLELSALGVFVMWGWIVGSNSSPWIGNSLAISLPVLAATVWGVFNVPGDPSRSGIAPVIIPGVLRLLIELTFFGLATYCLNDLNYTNLYWIFGGVVVLHYIVSYDRVLWLVDR